MESEQQKKLEKWSEETVVCYQTEINNIGENNATSFYNQSDLSKVRDCDIMIIGINPGMGISYSKWMEKYNVSQDFLYYGNPCFRGMNNEDIIKEMSEKYDPNKKRYGWDIWHKFHKMLGFSDKGDILEQLDRFVLSNMIFFGTVKEKDIPKGIDKVRCAKQTLKLIEILKPKLVVLLGKECRDLFVKATKGLQMKPLTIDDRVFYCYYNESHVISIYHTAYYKYYTNKNMEKIGNIMGYVLDNPSKEISISL